MLERLALADRHTRLAALPMLPALPNLADRIQVPVLALAKLSVLTAVGRLLALGRLRSGTAGQPAPRLRAGPGWAGRRARD